MTDDYRQRRKDGVLANAASPHCRLHAVPVSAVKMGEGFWQARIRRNYERGLPAVLKQLEEHGVIDNFLRLSGKKDVPRQGPLYTDSDLYKWLEGAAWTLHYHDSPQLEEAVDRVVTAIEEAQGDDGYLNTWFVDEREDERFTKIEEGSHELYCAGHLFQAALAHYRGRKDSRLLEVSVRFADYLCSVFGPGKRAVYAGHPEIEMALVEFYRETGKFEYLELAGFFVEQAGYRQMEEFEGHAVRAAYFAAGMTDYYAETGDETVWSIVEKQWQSMKYTKSYITGAIGGRHQGESVGRPYELPNERAYAETCGGIANAMWNFRLLQLKGEARFSDLMELALYNAFLAGVSLEGDHFFYVNPLRYNGKGEGDPWYKWARKGIYRRKPWFACTCCPTNAVRMFASLPGYLYSTSQDGLWVHLYDESTLDWYLEDGTPLKVKQSTDYPWDGTIDLELMPAFPAEFSLFLRIPGWCREYSLTVNGQPVSSPVKAGSYLEIKRQWNPGDKVRLELQMEPTLIGCHPRVAENRNSVALQRGPLVYCFEGVDNPDVPILDARLQVDGPLQAQFDPDLMGGMVRITCQGQVPQELPDSLYVPVKELPDGAARPVNLMAVPYFAWANRQPGPMTVWLERDNS